MEMQDKEFDNVFSTRLDNFEVEPSKAVWQGINDGLRNGNRKKILPFLGIAASIIVLIAAGVVFFTQKMAVVKPHGVKNRVAVNHPKKVITAVTAVKPQTATTTKSKIAAVMVAKSKYIVKTKMISKPVKSDIAKQQLTIVQPQQQASVSAIAPKNNVIKPKNIDSANAVAALTVVHPQTDKPAITAATTVPTEKTTDVSLVKKHRIHTFGDMLNVVIAAVDKRKDKVIEFSNTDGDESTITGVNLGIIKIKKEN